MSVWRTNVDAVELLVFVFPFLYFPILWPLLSIASVKRNLREKVQSSVIRAAAGEYLKHAPQRLKRHEVREELRAAKKDRLTSFDNEDDIENQDSD